MFFSEAIALIEPKLCINHWKVIYKLCVLYVDRNSKMTTTAGHSFYIGPIGSFYNQVNDTGSWEPLVNKPCQRQYELLPSLGVRRLSSVYFSHFNLLLSQMNWNSVGSIYGRSSLKSAHFFFIHYQTWPPQAIFVSDWPI